jgi:hypothetical protein
MTFEDKIAHFRQEQKSRGEKSYKFIPPIYFLLWKMGIRFRPPAFWALRQSILVNGILFGGLFGLLRWFFEWRQIGFSMETAIVTALCAAICIVAMVRRIENQRKRLSLGDWKTYPNQTK